MVSSQGIPILQCSAALSIHLLRTSSAGMTFRCDLNEVFIRDELSVDPSLPFLLSVKSRNINPAGIFRKKNRNDGDVDSYPTTSAKRHNNTSNKVDYNNSMNIDSSSGKATLSLRYETSNAKSKVTITSLPIEIVLHKHSIQRLINSFQRPPNIYASRNKKKKWKASRRYDNNNTHRSRMYDDDDNDMDDAVNHRLRQKQQYKKKKSGSRRSSHNGILQAARIFNQIVQKHNADDVLEVVLEVHAPKIIIPEYSIAGDRKDRGRGGYLLIDCGYFQLNGLSSSSGISLDLSVQEVCVGMPITIADMHTLEEMSLYLIKVRDH